MVVSKRWPPMPRPAPPPPSPPPPPQKGSIVVASAPCQKERDALQAIADVLSGEEWNVDSFDQIAGILTGAGYKIKDLMKDED